MKNRLPVVPGEESQPAWSTGNCGSGWQSQGLLLQEVQARLRPGAGCISGLALQDSLCSLEYANNQELHCECIVHPERLKILWREKGTGKLWTKAAGAGGCWELLPLLPTG